MPILNHILFPTDGSENSKHALEYVKELASKGTIKITILNVYELPIFIHNNELSKDIYDEIIHNTKSESGKILETCKKELQDTDDYIDTLSLEGKAGDVIVKTAQVKNCDLIVMGSRGLGTLKSFLLGSASNYVLHNSLCPVLIVPEPPK